MSTESIVSLMGLGVAILVFLGLSVFESREYKHSHDGEGMIHHWLAAHHMLDWRHRH